MIVREEKGSKPTAELSSMVIFYATRNTWVCKSVLLSSRVMFRISIFDQSVVSSVRDLGFIREKIRGNR